MTAPAAYKVYVLNLDRDSDRLDHMRTQLDQARMPWVRIPAVLGAALDANALNQALDRPGFERTHGMTPALGEVGCYLSHLRAHQALLDSSDEFAVILEDDVVITEALPRAVDALLKHPQDWDMVKLSQIHSGTPVQCRDLGQGLGLAVMLSQCTGSSAYIINRRAAQAYLAKLLPMRVPYDHAFDRSWDLGIKVRLITPTPCNHDYSFGTTIVTHGQQRKFKWHQRMPTYGYRLRNELARVTWGLGQIARSKLGLGR